MSNVAELSARVDLFDLHAAQPEAFPYFFESAAAHPETGRYDLLFGQPTELRLDEDPFAALDGCVPEPALAHPELPFVGGWVFLLAYEALGWVEPEVPRHPLPQGLPRSLLARCPEALIQDRLSGRLYAVSEAGQMRAQALLQSALNAPKAVPPAVVVRHLAPEPAEAYRAGVCQVHDYLLEGDVFQVNLSRSWRGELDADDPTAVYAALRRRNPAPFAALMRGDSWNLVSSSPERLVRLEAGEAETRPIAGTRPRGNSRDEDEAQAQALQESAKEQAEHIMLIDLERNDLGRVCEPGSVRVDTLMGVEPYAHVQHLVSSVRGRLRPGVGAGSVLRAVFPGGTITGCPKVRCMEIIHELETGARGYYTGSLGYLSRCGRLDSNILIRSLVLQGRALEFRAGAGIVADSDPELERRETEAKAKGLLAALGALSRDEV